MELSGIRRMNVNPRGEIDRKEVQSSSGALKAKTCHPARPDYIPMDARKLGQETFLNEQSNARMPGGGSRRPKRPKPNGGVPGLKQPQSPMSLRKEEGVHPLKKMVEVPEFGRST